MKRNKNLDTVRGIACILLVLYHVIGGNPESGLRLDSTNELLTFNHVLSYIRMPLFTFLSGVVYALRPVSAGTGSQFAGGKVKRLLLPFICVSLLFSVSQKLIPGTNAKLEWQDIPLVLVWPYAHLWFIYALLIVFAFIGSLDYWRILDKPLHIVGLFALACILFEFRYGAVGVMGWNRALYLLPFFLAGVVVMRFGWRWGMLCAFLALGSPAWEIALGVAFGMALFAWAPAIPLLARVGVYSYSIYLFHVFGTAGSRIVLEQFGIQMLAPLVVLGTISGLLVPIILHAALSPVPYVSRALLGVRRRQPRTSRMDQSIADAGPP